jgi:hypothetical protein
MPTFDVARFKELLSASGTEPQEPSPQEQLAVAQRAQTRRGQREVAQLLKPALAGAGVDLDRLDGLARENQRELRRIFQERKAAAARPASAATGGTGREPMRAALELLPAAAPGLSSLLALPQPFLVWEWPRSALGQELVGAHLEPWRSSARINLDVPIYAFDDDGSSWRTISFYFYWANSGQYQAVVNCFTALALNGALDIQTNTGFFSGDFAELDVQAALYPLQYWRPLQPGQDLTSLRVRGDPSQVVPVTTLSCQGGGLFGHPGHAAQLLTNKNVGPTFGTGLGGFVVPPQQTALFEVTVELTYRWSGHTLPDEIAADFSSQAAYGVLCPVVVLQFLTQPPSAQ